MMPRISFPTFTDALNKLALSFSERSYAADLLVFLSYLLTAKLGQYILFNLNTSPALIWAPTGIALAAVILKGNRMWLPIACAHLLAALTIPVPLPVLGKLLSVVAYTAQALIGAAALRQFGSGGTVHRTRDVAVLSIGAILIAAIAPLINTLGQLLIQYISDPWPSLSRAWAGNVLSILVVTPLITGWYHSARWPIPRDRAVEGLSAFTLLLVATYLIFWTSLTASIAFPLIFLLCISLFWIATRFGSRVVVTSIATLTGLGISGTIIAHPGALPINQQLIADELFIILLTPIFYTFFTLMEERRLTEVKLAEKIDELERATLQLSENDKAKNEFIAILAHELRNPLSTIVMGIDMLKLENLKPNVVEMLDQGEKQVHAMKRMLDDLLDVARITEKKFTLIKEGIDLGPVLTRSAAVCDHLMRLRNQTLTISIPDTPIPILADPLRVEQIMVNLLTNASKYTPLSGKISLECMVGDRSVRVEIADNGQGIALEDFEKIFSPFQQLNEERHRASGVGIGLFLSRQMVEMHGGSIHVQSQGKGLGSRFSVVFPLSKESPVTSNTDTKVVADATASDITRRILIVDDNVAAATGLSTLLQYKGHTTHTAHSGADALTGYVSFQPDVVVLDIGLPDMSGHQVARTLRKSAPVGSQTILIALTGYGQESDRIAALDAGFDYHLTKPVSVADIHEIVVRPPKKNVTETNMKANTDVGMPLRTQNTM